jgi:hypothetical protein
MGGPQSRSGRGGEEKNFQPPPAIEPQNPNRPAHSPELYRLSYHSYIIIIIIIIIISSSFWDEVIT